MREEGEGEGVREKGEGEGVREEDEGEGEGVREREGKRMWEETGGGGDVRRDEG